MPRHESETQSSGGATRGRQHQQPQEERVERPGTVPWLDGHSSPQPPAQSSTPQVPFPFVIGQRGSFITASQLQFILLQQCGPKEMNKQLLQYGQHRPSVLRRGTRSLPQALSTLSGLSARSDLTPTPSSDPAPICKVEAGGGLRGTSPQRVGHSPQHTSHTTWPRRSSPKQGSAHSDRNDSPVQRVPDGTSALFMNGVCRWPGCEEVFEEYPSFLKHLCIDHRPGDKSISQWRVQRDIVQHMENQLTVEKQRLLAMQLHLHLPEPRSTYSKVGIEGESSLAASSPLSRVIDGTLYRPGKETSELVSEGHWHLPTSHSLPGIIPSIECYKYNNIRPPYTYASLIRWAILESPEKQLTLSEIYHWFTRMFFYFRHNTATWKNAVRHNLSLHKCFVRVEGGKGAVWTVDEAEFQRRKGQKFNRDHHDVTWLAPYTFLCPQEATALGQTGSR
ncbi:hypothetical protein MATL_G00070380 [Megalops atlanticus]|uniref:Fork-head domain-containing protein n=1 Tax=Megalops atlanticus TaxID=7932 RepID=A0A9D3Q471_MEGAT|nr:hypothetical protein MATL_G00070380 [Megalops atlanticus]